MKNSNNPQITIKAVCAWLFGAIFLITGLGALMTNIVGGLVLLAVSAILLPPISKRLKVDFSSGIKVILALIAIGIFSATTDTDSLNQNLPSNEVRTEPTKAIEQPKAEEYKLELLSNNTTRQHGFITITGEVKNITDKKMDAVQVVVSFYDEQGTFVKDGTAVIEYNPILAGQTSPFTVIETDNPAMEKTKITFKKLFGGTIPTKFE